MRHTLISTVGTSLFTNIQRLEQGHPLKESFARRNWVETALKLLELPPEDHTCGAEINSITSMLQRGKLDQRQRLIFLISDTKDGRHTGQVLKHYYSHSKNPYRFDQVNMTVVEGLRDDDVNAFKNQGLRNLVKEISKLVQQYSSASIAINATGGYKAQISFAGLIGQTLEIPVYYLFERFAEVIELPPQPVALDLGFWLEHYEVLQRLDTDTIARDELGPNIADPRFQPLIDEVKINGQTYVALSATGQLFHEGFRYRFTQQKTRLLPPDVGIVPTEKVIKYEDKNAEKHPGLATYLKRILEAPYVKRIYTHYYNPDLPLKNYFRRSASGEVSQIEGGYSENKATTKFDVITTVQTVEEQQAVVVDLNERFCTL